MGSLWKRFGPAPLFLVAGLVASGPSLAENPWNPRFELRLTSDYIYRGYSQTKGDPALQAAFGVSHRSGFVGGVWGSNVAFAFDERLLDSPRTIELRAFAGYARELGADWSLNAVAVYHDYPGTGAVDGYGELNVSARFREVLLLSVAWSDSIFTSERSGFFGELSGSYPLPLGINLVAGFGWAEMDLEAEPHYGYGNIGVSRPFRHFGVELGYYASNAPVIPPWGEAIDDRWVVSFSFWIPAR